MIPRNYEILVGLGLLVIFYELGILELVFGNDVPEISRQFFYLFILPITTIVWFFVRPWMLRKHASDSKTINYKRITIGVFSAILLFVVLIWLMTVLL